MTNQRALFPNGASRRGTRESCEAAMLDCISHCTISVRIAGTSGKSTRNATVVALPTSFHAALSRSNQPWLPLRGSRGG